MFEDVLIKINNGVENLGSFALSVVEEQGFSCETHAFVNYTLLQDLDNEEYYNEEYKVYRILDYLQKHQMKIVLIEYDNTYSDSTNSIILLANDPKTLTRARIDLKKSLTTLNQSYPGDSGSIQWSKISSTDKINLTTIVDAENKEIHEGDLIYFYSRSEKRVYKGTVVKINSRSTDPSFSKISVEVNGELYKTTPIEALLA